MCAVGSIGTRVDVLDKGVTKGLARSPWCLCMKSFNHAGLGLMEGGCAVWRWQPWDEP